MSIISNYIFKEIGSYFLYITIFFISLIWLIISLRFIEYITANGLSFIDFASMTSLLIPKLVPHLTPITLSLACIWVYHKFSNDNELIILKSSGLSKIQILKPAILLAIIISLFNLILNLYLGPLSKETFKEKQKDLRDNIARIAFKEGSFSNLYEDTTIYIEEIIDKNNFAHVFVFDNRNKDNPATYIAQQAELVQNDVINKVILKNGNRQIMDKKNSQLNIITFDKYDVDLDIVFKKNTKERIKEPDEMFLTELWDKENNIKSKKYDDNQINSLIIEGHKRIINPLYCIIFALISLTFLLSDKLVLKTTTKKTAIIISVIFIIELIYLALPDYIIKQIHLLPAMYFFPFCLLFLLIITNLGLYFKRIKNK